MPFATAEDGVRIHYDVEGTGPALVLMHGTSGSGQGWRDRGYVDRLKDRFQLVLMDSRGHGESDKPREQAAYELRGRVLDIAAVLNALEIPKAHFLGYSMGGWIGWGITIYMPQRFHSLAIGGMGPVPDPYFGRTFEEFVANREPPLEGEQREVMHAVFSETARFGGARQALKKSSLPILLYCGDQDPRFASMRDAAPLGRHTTFVALPGKDHRGASADPDAVDVIVPRLVEFFEGVTVA